MIQMKNEQENILYLAYSTPTSGGEICEGQEEDEWPSYETTYYDFEIIGLYKSPPNKGHYCHQFTVNDSIMKKPTLFLALVRYSDGDTFGSSSGHTAFVGLESTKKKAQKLLDEAMQPTKKGDYSSYKPWEGYFSSVESTDIVQLEVKD